MSEETGFVEYQDGWAVQARGLQGEEINWVFDLEGSPASLLEVVNSRGESVTVPVPRKLMHLFVGNVSNYLDKLSEVEFWESVKER